MNESAGGRLRLAAALILIAALIAALRFLPVSAWLRTSDQFFGRLGLRGLLLYVILYALAAVLFVPGSPLTLAAGAIYGLGWGFVAVSAGSTLGASAAFLIARYVARRRVERWAAGHLRFTAIDRAVGREGWLIVLLTRLSPVFPFNVLNYLYGLTGISFGSYVLWSWIGMMPGTLLYVYLGFAGRAVAQAAAGGSRRSPAEYALFGIGLAATVAVTVYVTRMAGRALRGRASPASS